MILTSIAAVPIVTAIDMINTARASMNSIGPSGAFFCAIHLNSESKPRTRRRGQPSGAVESFLFFMVVSPPPRLPGLDR